MIPQSLRVAGFSKRFCKKSLPKPLRQAGFVVTIDDPNLLRMVLKDFTEHVAEPTTLSFTKIGLAAIEEAEELKEGDLQVATVGPGIHQHDQQALWLCMENHDLETHGTVGLVKYQNRVALCSPESMDMLKQYIQSMKRKSEEDKRLKLNLAFDGSWLTRATHKRRAHTLFMGSLWTEILTDAQDFLDPETEKWYADHGMPYHRKYIFHGTPGCGKSTAVRVLASELDVPLYMINLGAARMDDEMLISLVHDIPPRSMVALEDVDRAFTKISDDPATHTAINEATILNLLDGTLSKDGLITVMTCNHYDMLNDALRRHGRTDRVFEFKPAQTRDIQHLFQSFYPEAAPEAAQQFATFVNHQQQAYPMATLQEFFIRHRKCTATEALTKMSTDPLFSEQRKRMRTAYD